MNNKILALLKSTWGLLIFALLCGGAYYVIVLKFILSHTEVGGSLLGFFFLPAIVCGAALVLIKIIKQCIKDERVSAIAAIFWLHAVFIALSVVFAASMLA